MKRWSLAHEGRSVRPTQHPFESGSEKKALAGDIGVAPPTCSMPGTDEDGHPDLCCCTIMDTDGSLQDACFRPADDCC